jgi:hypothetical protein
MALPCQVALKVFSLFFNRDEHPVSVAEKQTAGIGVV